MKGGFEEKVFPAISVSFCTALLQVRCGQKLFPRWVFLTGGHLECRDGSLLQDKS